MSMLEYWSVILVGSDILWRSWISWYMGLCSPMCCFEMRCLWWWYDWMCSCSNGMNSVAWLVCFLMVMVSLIGLYSCLLLKVSNAYADWGLLCFMHLICSWCLWVSHFACVTCTFIDSTFVLFLCVVDHFWFCKLLQFVGAFKGYSHICVLE